jgi:hypothetical protein
MLLISKYNLGVESMSLSFFNWKRIVPIYYRGKYNSPKKLLYSYNSSGSLIACY